MIVKYNYSTKVDSTSIDSVYFDSVTKRLAIKFVNGNWAGYQNVPGYIYTNLISSDSAGSYYNRTIRGCYTGFKVDGVVDTNNQQGEPAVSTQTSGKFKVVAEITGDVTLDVHATDLTHALKVAEEQINKAFGGDVRVSFKGVNLV